MNERTRSHAVENATWQASKVTEGEDEGQLFREVHAIKCVAHRTHLCKRTSCRQQLCVAREQGTEAARRTQESSDRRSQPCHAPYAACLAVLLASKLSAHVHTGPPLSASLRVEKDAIRVWSWQAVCLGTLVRGQQLRHACTVALLGWRPSKSSVPWRRQRARGGRTRQRRRRQKCQRQPAASALALSPCVR